MSISHANAKETSYVYTDWEGNTLCVQHRIQKSEKDKTFFTEKMVEGKLIKGAPEGSKPIYNLLSLKMFPTKPVLFVEGEKCVEAGIDLFPEFNVVCWLGGSSASKKADLTHFNNMSIYLLPDNDSPGYKAMDELATRLSQQGNSLFMIDIKRLGVPDKWDIADLGNDHGEIEPEDLRLFVLETDVYKEKIQDLDLLSFPDLSNSKQPKILDTTNNVKHLLQHYNIKVYWNMMKRTRDINVPNVDFYNEESENASLTYLTNLAVLNYIPTKRIDKHLDLLAWENLYHPVRDWIMNTKLTRPGIFNQFLQTIKTTNDQLSYILIKRWMISAIASLFTDTGFCAQGVLVIQGDPGTHKSTFVMSLVPESMRAIKGGLSLDPSKKDDIFTSSEYWIAELGELDATFKKADIARLKSHITNDIDDIRRAYAVRSSKMIRRTVYAATVNEARFLVDTTGNRRWWTISVTEPIQTRHGLDMQQIWREIYEMWMSGESPILLKEELIELNSMNEQFEYIEPFEEKLDMYFDWEWKDRRMMMATEILQIMGYEKPTKSESTKMASILMKRNIIKGKGRMRRHYLMPVQNIVTA